MSREDMKTNFRDFRATVKMQTEAVIQITSHDTKHFFEQNIKS